jgi:YtkA-like
VSLRAHRVKLVIAGCALAAVLGVGALAATASPSSRQTLMSQLHRAARVSRGSGTTLAGVTRDGYRVTVLVTPDRVTAPDYLSVRVTRHGRVVRGAHVGIAFSMPSMNMWNAYSASLVATGARYSATVPVLGMTGDWQLRVRVHPPGTRGFAVVMPDRMTS